MKILFSKPFILETILLSASLILISAIIFFNLSTETLTFLIITKQFVIAVNAGINLTIQTISKVR